MSNKVMEICDWIEKKAEHFGDYSRSVEDFKILSEIEKEIAIKERRPFDLEAHNYYVFNGCIRLENLKKSHGKGKHETSDRKTYQRNIPDWRSLRLATFQRDNYTCVYCGIKPESLHCDHVVPYSKGGGNDLDNLATSCPSCNKSKGSKTLEEWINR